MDGIRALGSPEELEAEGCAGVPAEPRALANTHIHLPPNFSAFESVRQAVELSDSQGVRVLGASNYYDFAVYDAFAAECRKRGIFPLFGLEIIALIEDLEGEGVLINDPGNPGKMYICGKAMTRFNPMTAAAVGLIARVRANDDARMHRMIEKTEAIFAANGLGTGLTAGRIAGRIVDRHGVDPASVSLQERHVAQAFQEALFEIVPEDRRLEQLASVLEVRPESRPGDHVGIQNEIRTHLMKKGKRAFIPEAFLGFSEAYRLILELGGIPCYPTLADGASPICAYEDPPKKLIGVLLSNGVYCAEFIPTRNRPDVLARYVRAMHAAGMVVTAGTEHNTLDLVPMEPACRAGIPVPDGIGEIFREGACVLAAHQFLSLHGRTGYVDGSGRLNAAFGDPVQLRNRLSRLGGAVLARYDEQRD